MKNDRTYHRLKESIYRGRLRPGHRIVERDLARRMGVSRIPLRESLVRLETEGLVRSVPYSATFVEDLSPVDVLEIYSMRLLLEPLATRLAAAKGEPALVEKLKRLCEQMTHDTTAANAARLDRTDYRFHHAIVAGSGHKRLIRAYDGAHIRIIGPRTNFADVLRQPPDSTAREHMKIVQYIERRDPDRAEKCAREAVQTGLRCVEQAIGMTLDQIQS
jgi:DNA-binding GntR family transcriptional regulator